MPNTFLKPMEASALAAREMALNPENQRPVWADDKQSIIAQHNADFGNLVSTSGGSVKLIHKGRVHENMQFVSRGGPNE